MPKDAVSPPGALFFPVMLSLRPHPCSQHGIISFSISTSFGKVVFISSLFLVSVLALILRFWPRSRFPKIDDLVVNVALSHTKLHSKAIQHERTFCFLALCVVFLGQAGPHPPSFLLKLRAVVRTGPDLPRQTTNRGGTERGSYQGI